VSRYLPEWPDSLLKNLGSRSRSLDEELGDLRAIYGMRNDQGDWYDGSGIPADGRLLKKQISVLSCK